MRKALSNKQKASRKPPQKTALSGLRDKKVQCPSKMTMVLTNPSKTMTQAKSPWGKILCSHKAHIKLDFNHNHPVESAHVLSFRPVGEATKEAYFSLFRIGHSASSARHYHESTILQSEPSKAQKLLADRSVNPNHQDVYRLYSKWKMEEMGEENGKGMLQRLQVEVDTYNEKWASEGGIAKLQWFQDLRGETSDNSDAEDFIPPPKKRKTTHQPLIVAICTPMMSRAHNHIVQSGEMVFLDSTSSLDRYNTSVFILSAAHPGGGVPLGVILASDEKEETITTGLKMLQEVLPKEAFYNKGPHTGPTICMTDDSQAEKGALSNVWPNATQLLCIFHFLLYYMLLSSLVTLEYLIDMKFSLGTEHGVHTTHTDQE